jgi:predicted lipoprotein with Yx(FWY)xxD motif
LLALAFAGLGGCRGAHSPPTVGTAAWNAPVAVPGGVTLVPLGEKSRIAGKSVADLGGDDDQKPGAAYAVRLGAADGAPLYFSDQEQTCTAECSRQFPPFLAPADAVADGAWTLLGAGAPRQWAYRGNALHVRVLKDGDAAALPASWHLAVFAPALDVQLPPGIELRESRTAGAVLTDSRGLTLYRLNESLGDFARHCDLRCQQPWSPLYAAALAATAVGDFSMLQRPDGTRQWAHRGAALFSYEGDSLPGETGGIDTAASPAVWQVAQILRYPQPPQIASREDPEQGPIWVTRGGAPLYTRHRYDANDFGGKNFRGTFHQPYGVGKDIGVSGCDAVCQQEWPPLLADADARPQGYWQIIVRADGRRQWAYKGYVLYTYSHDPRDGTVTGTNLYTLDRGDAGRYKVADIPTLGDRTLFREGAYFWHVAIPDL